MIKESITQKNKKYLNVSKKDENLLKHTADLKNLLIKSSPSEIGASNYKEGANSSFYETEKALDFKFIQFNNKLLKWCIFDSDKVKIGTSEEIISIDYYKTIDNFIKECLSDILAPTYVKQTDKGYHFGYYIIDDLETIEFASEIKLLKTELTRFKSLDANASNRTKGVFRNPIYDCDTYELRFFPDNVYTHEQFKNFINNNIKPLNKIEISNETKSKTSKSKKPKISDYVRTQPNYVSNIYKPYSEIKVGERNDVIMAKTTNYFMTKKKRGTITYKDVYEYAENINSKIQTPLETQDLKTISTSVLKYHNENGSEKNLGACGFEGGCFSKKQVKFRQKKGAEYSAIQKVDKNYNKYLEAIKVIEQLGDEPTNKLIMDITKFTKSTVIKYKKMYQAELVGILEKGVA